LGCSDGDHDDGCRECSLPRGERESVRRLRYVLIHGKRVFGVFCIVRNLSVVLYAPHCFLLGSLWLATNEVFVFWIIRNKMLNSRARSNGFQPGFAGLI